MNGSGRVDDAALGGDSVKETRLAVWVLLAVMAMAALGFGVVKIVGASPTDADCGSYGYGGYQSYGGYGGYGCEPGRGDAHADRRTVDRSRRPAVGDGARGELRREHTVRRRRVRRQAGRPTAELGGV